MSRIKTFLTICSFWSLLSCGNSDEVSVKYATLKEAQIDVDRGWIPPVLPPSTYSIEDSHNLDVNVGEGAFKFNPTEYSSFITKLTVTNQISLKGEAELRKRGFKFFTYSEKETIWPFALHPDAGVGKYRMELKR